MAKIMTSISLYKSLKNRVRYSRKVNNIISAVDYTFTKDKESRLFFIFGCQRSGTTLLRDTIGKDFSTKAYGEGDEPYFYPRYSHNRLRLRSNHEVSELVKYDKCKHILLKPLYESQWAGQWLDNFPGSKAIWIYRNYTDVVDSHINYYKDINAVEYVKSALMDNAAYPWIHENIGRSTIDRIKPFLREKLTSADAFALYWYIRNTHYQSVSDNPGVIKTKYENLVINKEHELPRIFRFLGLPYKQRYLEDFRSDAINKKITFEISPSVKELCEEMTSVLNENAK